MEEHLSAEHIGTIFRKALSDGLIRPGDTVVQFQDLEFLERRIRRLLPLFPDSTLHALAIKSNPFLKIMALTRAISSQIGVEAASIGEVLLALEAGYEPGRIVYDSPVKTVEELEFALAKGVRLNIDNLSELERVEKLLSKRPSGSIIGLRVNPQVGTGTIAESSTAGEYSKFGVPVRSRRTEILEAFNRHPWLTGLHLHVGSQGCTPELLAEGVKVVCGVMQDTGCRLPAGKAGMQDAACLPARQGCRIRQVDIGGGFPITYDYGVVPPRIEEYAAALKSTFPSLFTAHCSLITEFGRWVYVPSGWTVSRVEYVKRDPGINTAMIHAGADLFVRECLSPSDWRHAYSVTDREGNLKEGVSDHPWNLAGPLCFSGDILAKNQRLPEIEEGDYVIIHDTGGYTYSMWSRYNSRYAPRVTGYSGNGFTVLKEREEFDDLKRFWG